MSDHPPAKTGMNTNTRDAILGTGFMALIGFMVWQTGETDWLWLLFILLLVMF